MSPILLKSDNGYGWITGENAATEQVIAADTITVVFDQSGDLIRFSEEVPSHWESRKTKLLVEEKTISILPFNLPEHACGIRREITEGREDLIFVLGDIFWLNEDGSVESH